MNLRAPRSRTAAITPSINVTPLVDVVLVLLIIFMVMTPKLDQDILVTLPSVFNADHDAVGAAPLTISAATVGEYFYEGRAYDLDGVIAMLETAHAADPNRRVVLRADAGLQYGSVRVLQRRLQEIGFPGLSFLVGERHRWEDETTNPDSAAVAPQ
jgi:biopolymer transport protein TolR